MIREIAEFTRQLDPLFKQMGLKPKEGLSLVLRATKNEERKPEINQAFEWSMHSKKDKNLDNLLQQCAAWTKAAWMIDTFKCLDAPYKAIHSASPFCLAFKRTALEGGASYQKIAADIKGGKNKKQIYERIDDYFEKALGYLEEEEEISMVEAFCKALNTKEKLHGWLIKSGHWEALKDTDYISFYLDLPVSSYELSHNRYLQKKLFNTEQYNKEDDRGEVWGTSNFFNSFGNKKPFLMHQSATFDISGRISSNDARQLHEFSELLGRNLFPRPLPIFIFRAELQKAVINIFKREALLEPAHRKSYSEIFQDLYGQHEADLGNYYLLYYTGGAIKDFDFVSKFSYKLRDNNGNPWQVKQLMKLGEDITLDNIFEFQNRILPDILNNALIVKTKKGLSFRYFEDIDQKYCDNNNAVIYGLVLKYRKAFYDFIYKSKRASLTPHAIRDIMLSGIAADIKRDEECKNTWKICHKLNIWFSLNHHFDPTNSNFNHLDMSSTIPRLIEKMRQVANEGAHFESPEEFAFGAGQIIYFLLYQNQSENKTHALLEPFTQKTNPGLLKTEISRVFDRYKHKIGFGKGRFEKLMREVLGYDEQIDLQKLFPILLAGYFSDAVIFETKPKNL